MTKVQDATATILRNVESELKRAIALAESAHLFDLAERLEAALAETRRQLKLN